MNVYERPVAERLQAEAARIPLPPRERWIPRERSRPRLMPVLATLAGLALVVLIVAPLLEQLHSRSQVASNSPTPATVTVLSLPAGQVLASPDGRLIAVVGTASVTLHDGDGRELHRWSTATVYSRWLPDGSGVLVQTAVTAPGSASLLVLETDGSTTRLTLAVPPANAGSTWLSPDGTRFAAQGAAEVLTIRRDGSAPQSVISGAEHQLLGFDRDGRILVRDGTDARALGVDGYVVPLPAAGNPLYEAAAGSSPDGTVALISMATPADQLIAIADRAAHVVPRPFSWVRGHELIGRLGAIELWDASTGDHRVIDAIPNSATLSATLSPTLHGVSGSRVLWSTAGVTHVTDLTTGRDRTVPALPVSARAQPLSGGRFLVIFDQVREVLAPE